MYQDQPGCFSTGEEQEVFGLVNVVTPLGKTRSERCAIDAVAVYHNHVTNADAPLLDRSGSGWLWRSLSNRLIIEHETFLTGRALRLARQAVLETIVQRLVRLSERHDLLSHIFWRCSFEKNACDEAGNDLHLSLMHPQARNLNGAHAQPTGTIPIFWPICRDQILVGDDVGP